MVVTPNLVNEQNYVMTTEYPTARKAGKIIVPIQAIPTDRAALESSFEGIPPCVDKADRQRLAQVLAEKMQGILRSEAASSAKHDFYIGMAYLNGVNVEVNHALAFSLIKRAATKRHPEAINQLAIMYAEGKGVNRDPDTALAWLNYRVDLMRSSSNPHVLCGIMLEYLESCTNLNRFSQAAAMAREVIGIAERLPVYDVQRSVILSNA